MQEIKAYVREQMLDHVIDALATIPHLPGVAVVHLRGYGHVADDGELERTDMAKLEIDVDDAMVDTVVGTIVAHARTGDGHPGDGKVLISDVRRSLRIADGQPADVRHER